MYLLVSDTNIGDPGHQPDITDLVLESYTIPYEGRERYVFREKSTNTCWLDPTSDALTGARADVGKDPWRLLPYDALSVLVKVYKTGFVKYGDRNWEKGLKYEETFDSLMRHSIAWKTGEDCDPESGIHHMAHVAWNALALLAFHLRGRTDLDNRA